MTTPDSVDFFAGAKTTLSVQAITLAGYGHDPVGIQSLCSLELASRIRSDRVRVSDLDFETRPCVDRSYGRTNKKEARRQRSEVRFVLELPGIVAAGIAVNRSKMHKRAGCDSKRTNCSAARAFQMHGVFPFHLSLLRLTLGETPTRPGVSP